jgi:hypothetical protein
LRNVSYPFSEITEEVYDGIKIEVEKNGSISTISIDPLPKFREKMELNEDILDYGTNGFPTQNSLFSKAEEYMNHLLELHEEPN